MRQFFTWSMPLLALVLALAPGCGDADGGVVRLALAQSGGARVAIQGEDDGRARYARRIDGSVTALYRAPILPDRDDEQWVLLTGWGSGRDQGCVIVLDHDGAVLMRHRVACDAPAGLKGTGASKTVGHRFLVPTASRFTQFSHGGRRYIALSTAAMWTPYTVEVLEVTDEPALVPRFRFWNPGGMHTPIVREESADGPGMMAVQCLNNTFKGVQRDVYPVAVCAFLLDDILDRDDGEEARVAWAPGLELSGYEDVDPGFLRYYVLPEELASDSVTRVTLRFEGDDLLTEIGQGLSYVLRPSEGTATLRATEDFRAKYLEWRADEPEMPTLDEVLAQQAIVFPEP